MSAIYRTEIFISLRPAAESQTTPRLATFGPTLAGLAIDANGNLYGSRTSTGGSFTTGAVFQIDPSTGATIRTIASGMTCPSAISVDPLSGDLFTDDSCGGGGADNPALFRISGR